MHDVLTFIGIMALIFCPFWLPFVIIAPIMVCEDISRWWKKRHKPDYRIIQQLEVELGFARWDGPKTQPWSWRR